MSLVKSEDLPDPKRPTVPRIHPVPVGEPRPFWSVMIPTYNCARFLRQTLESVLSQAPGPDEMQIEVIDDVSTKDDPEAVVREIGKGRVGFHRHSANIGATRNFNACLERSRGHWVHILHGDDYVEPGFYAATRAAVERYPSVGMIATRYFSIDEASEITGMGPRAESLEQGGTDAQPYTIANHFQFAAVILKRDFAENHGGFDLELVHVADWEMWIRAIRTQGGVFVNRPLACYRMFAGNDTARLQRTGENLRDYLRMKSVFASTVPNFDSLAFVRRVRDLALSQVATFRQLEDDDAVAANLRVWREITPLSARMKHNLKRVARRFVK